jgi:hypothetical protein
MLVQLGAKCVMGLATGIRKKFQPYAGQVSDCRALDRGHILRI